MPLTKEQFIKARKAGFSLDEIKNFEKTPLTKEQFSTARKSGFSAQEIINIKNDASKVGVMDKASELYGKFKNLPGIKEGDILVEGTAKSIEPTVPAGVSNAGLAMRLPQQMAAEFVRGYKPSDVLPFLGAAKLAKPVIMPIAKKAWQLTPSRVKEFLTKEFTVGKGLPEQFQTLLRKAKLEKDAGTREAEEVGKILSVAPKDMKVRTPQGNEIIVKQGQPITKEHARYIGRIFRKEIDLGGVKSRLNEPLDVTRRIASNVEVEVAFNPKLKSLNQQLSQVNKQLADKELQAQQLIGKQFELETGGVEQVTGVSKELPSLFESKNVKQAMRSKEKISLETEEIKAPLINQSSQSFGDTVLRSVSQVNKSKSINSLINKERKELLSKRNSLAKQIMRETIKIEEGVKINYYIFDRKYTEQIRNHPKFKELSEIANKGRDIMDKWSKALVESGIPKERASLIIEEGVGEYMGRMYEKHLVKGVSGFSLKNLRLRLRGLKHRKDLTEEVKTKMGEIKEPALPTAIRVKEISTSVANNKIFKEVASNPEWSSTKNITGNMVQMPKGNSMGALSGKFVVKEIADEINAITSLKTQNLALELYNKSLNAWKYGKVVLNPATHFRNMLSNSMLLDLSGVGHFRQAQLFPRVVKDYIQQGPLYQAALKNGAISGEFVGGEVAMVEKFYNYTQGSNLQKWIGVMKAPFTKAGEMYRAEEQISKMIKFADEIDRGKTAELAALEAQKWLFNYEEIPNAIKVAKHIAPFVTFTYKSVPRVAEALVNNPLKIYKYYALANAFNESSRKMLNMTPEDFAREEKALPPWLLRSIGGMPSNLLMPWRDKNGRTEWLNLEYMIPLGMAPDILDKGILKGAVSNPFVTLFADLSKNKDFTGKDIIPVGSTRAEAAKITTEYIYRQLAPTLAPGLLDLSDGDSIFKGGYSFEKIMTSIYQKPDYLGRVRDIEPVVFDVLMGLKLTPVDVSEAENFKMFNKKRIIEELTHQASSLNRPNVSPEERDKQMENIFIKIQKVMEED